MEDITIPKGYEAKIEGDKVVFVKKESEDERIRKEIVKYLTNAVNGQKQVTPRTNEFDAWMRYLEKQKEPKSASPQGGSSEIPNNQWSEEDKRMLDDIDESLFMYEAGQNDYTQEQVERERKWLKSLPERFK